MVDRTLINFQPKPRPTYLSSSCVFLDVPCHIGNTLQTCASSCVVDEPSIWKIWTSTGFILRGWKQSELKPPTRNLKGRSTIPHGIVEGTRVRFFMYFWDTPQLKKISNINELNQNQRTQQNMDATKAIAASKGDHNGMMGITGSRGANMWLEFQEIPKRTRFGFVAALDKDVTSNAPQAGLGGLEKMVGILQPTISMAWWARHTDIYIYTKIFKYAAMYALCHCISWSHAAVGRIGFWFLSCNCETRAR